MIRKIFLLTLMSFFSFLVYGQSGDSLRHTYNNQTIYRYGSSFLKGNERLSFRDLEKEFSMSDLGLASYTKAKKYKTTSLIFRIGSILSGLAAIAVVADNNTNMNSAYILLGGQFALAIGGGRYSSLSQQSLDRAIWQRNKDILFPPK